MNKNFVVHQSTGATNISKARISGVSKSVIPLPKRIDASILTKEDFLKSLDKVILTPVEKSPLKGKKETSE